VAATRRPHYCVELTNSAASAEHMIPTQKGPMSGGAHDLAFDGWEFAATGEPLPAEIGAT
jgi:hypothetical protein